MTIHPGRRIAAGRALRRQTQAQLALRMAEITGDTWSRNNIAAIENGQRAFKVDYLHAFSEAQDLPISWYLGDDAASGDTGGYPFLVA
jgi:transcriptional regulator with XRE-family HTH domain